MRTAIPVFIVPMLVLMSACSSRVDRPGDVQAVRQLVDDYVKAVNAGDSAAIAAMMTDTTFWCEPHMPMMIGRDGIGKLHQAFFDQFTVELSATAASARVAFDSGVVRGTYLQKLTPKAEGAASVSDSGNWAAAVGRRADGSWKFDWNISNSDQPMPGTTADGAEEQALMQIEREWATALEKRDVAALDRILAKEWSGSTNGRNTSRAQALADHKAGVYRFESFKVRDLSVHVFGDAAVATMIVVIKGSYKGKDISGRERSTDFFVMRDGRWQAVSSQNVTIKP